MLGISLSFTESWTSPARARGLGRSVRKMTLARSPRPPALAGLDGTTPLNTYPRKVLLSRSERPQLVGVAFRGAKGDNEPFGRRCHPPESVRLQRSTLDSGTRARSNEGSVKLNEVVGHRALAQFW